MSKQKANKKDDFLTNPLITLFLGMVLLIFTTVFIVKEGQQALVSRFGKLRSDMSGQLHVYSPGLHFHLPFTDTVSRVDMRLQGFLVPSERIYTQEQKNVRVDYYVRYIVEDIERFYLSTNANYTKANMILRGKINDTLREEIGKRQLNDVITGQRGDIMNTLRVKSHESARNIGINVIDVRVVRLDYPQEVSQSVYRRMREARERMATMYRAEGDSESEMIRAKGDADVVRLLAKSKQEAADIRAHGDSGAAKVYTDAYKKNDEFFMFLRSMELYDKAMNSNETMLLDLETFKVFDQFMLLNDR